MDIVYQKGKISHKWIKNNVPNGYCVLVYITQIDYSSLHIFGNDGGAALDFLHSLDKSICYATVFKNGILRD